MTPSFQRYIGINYSGAEVPNSPLPALRIYAADGGGEPVEVLPPQDKPARYWTRAGIAEWLAEAVGGDVATLIGINHAFSFPLPYFVRYGLPPDWRVFLDDFCLHWPTDARNTYVDFVLEGIYGNAAARWGHRGWLRLTEQRTARRRSLFHFAGPYSVAKATHAGLPWLRFLDRQAHGRLHFWPLDGWTCPPGRSMMAETAPALCAAQWPQAHRSPHQHSAYATAAWLQAMDRSGTLEAVTQPKLDAEQQRIAQLEGWILGVA